MAERCANIQPWAFCSNEKEKVKSHEVRHHQEHVEECTSWYLDKCADSMEKAGDQKEWDNDLEKQQAAHDKWRENCDKAVDKAGIKAIDTSYVASAKEG